MIKNKRAMVHQKNFAPKISVRKNRGRSGGFEALGGRKQRGLNICTKLDMLQFYQTFLMVHHIYLLQKENE